MDFRLAKPFEIPYNTGTYLAHSAYIYKIINPPDKSLASTVLSINNLHIVL